MENWECLIDCAPNYWKALIFEPGEKHKKLLKSNDLTNCEVGRELCKGYLPEGCFVLTGIEDSKGVWRIIYSTK